MISRRLLRIKTLKLLFSNAGAEKLALERIEKDLHLSIQKTYDLYYFLFSAIIYVADYAEERIDIALKKFHPTYEEAHPNRKFISNQVIRLIRQNAPLRHYCENHRLSWGGDNLNVIRHLYKHMTEQTYYKKYMESETQSFEEDIEFVKDFFTYEFEDNLLLESALEEQSIWWIDDVGYALGSIIRSLDKLTAKQPNDVPLPQTPRSKEDEEFAVHLLRHSLIHYNEYWKVAMQFIKNWEADRVATMDMALIVQGFSEAMEFPTIPVKVTINEHVEIAKFYSTHNSHIFVNGVLDRMIQQGIADGTVNKQGRGLAN